MQVLSQWSELKNIFRQVDQQGAATVSYADMRVRPYMRRRHARSSSGGSFCFLLSFCNVLTFRINMQLSPFNQTLTAASNVDAIVCAQYCLCVHVRMYMHNAHVAGVQHSFIIRIRQGFHAYRMFYTG